jgi:hypothetical protein
MTIIGEAFGFRFRYNRGSQAPISESWSVLPTVTLPGFSGFFIGLIVANN